MPASRYADLKLADCVADYPRMSAAKSGDHGQGEGREQGDVDGLSGVTTNEPRQLAS